MANLPALTNYLQFSPDANYPAGLYDLDQVAVECPGGDYLLLTLKLGYVYDTYRLEFRCGAQTTWELIFEDSAVVAREERLLAAQPPFTCSSGYVYFGPVPMNLGVDTRRVTANAFSLRIIATEFENPPRIIIGLDKYSQVIFAQGSVSIEAVSPDGDNWPSDEWKDWNMM